MYSFESWLTGIVEEQVDLYSGAEIVLNMWENSLEKKIIDATQYVDKLSDLVPDLVALGKVKE